jgi:cation transport ATPase
MNVEDPLQQNIRRTTGAHALKQIGEIVDKENRDEAATSRAVRQTMRYGLIVLLILAAVLAHLMGVY